MSNFVKRQQKKAINEFLDNELNKPNSLLTTDVILKIVDSVIEATIDRLDSLMYDGYYYSEAIEIVYEDLGL